MTSPPRQRDPQREREKLESLVETLRAGRYEEGVAQAEALLAEGLIHPLPLRLTASARQQTGRFEDAIHLFQKAIELAPRDASGWAALAACYFAAMRPEAALEASQAALSLAPGEPALLCGRAQLLQSLSRIDEAAALYRRALEVHPNLFEACLGLATLAIEAGAWDEAEAYAREMEQRRESVPTQLWLEARIALGRGDYEHARAQSAALLEDKKLLPAKRAEALLLRGQALDALERTSEAFQAVVEGKAIQHQLYAERAAGGEGEIAKLQRLAEWFSTADPADWRWAPAPSGPTEAADHVFIVGFPRSGTTLLEQALAGHAHVAALEEPPTLAEHYAEFMTCDEDLQRLAQLAPSEAALWRARYWAEVRAQGVEPNGKVFVDKQPAGTLTLPLITKLFPEARIIFALRDPRDVVLSCLRQNFQLNAMTYCFTRLADTAACYDACMALAEVYRGVLPLRMMDTRHEDLVEDFPASLARIADFLELAVSPDMMDFAATARRRKVRTPSAPQVRAGLNRTGLARWRAYARQLGPVMSVLEPWVEGFGYPVD